MKQGPFFNYLLPLRQFVGLVRMLVRVLHIAGVAHVYPPFPA
jgi:hypothetical protein